MDTRGYEMIVGLEVHCELNTKTKIYCSCRNSFGAEVNSQCCPVCMGMPGTLPTLNEKVVDYAVKMGYALNCSINPISKQDRKNYFYPDLPKAYQISQFDIPLCENGHLDILVDGKEKRIGITRIHIEEDAGKLIHDESFAGTLVDFNRCGVPLIEIVSEPDLRSSAEAKAYLDTIREIVIYLGISDGKMQEGSIRCDINVSVHKPGEPFGTRVEMKNVNTFSGAVRAIEYEAARQIEVLENGGTISQETRRWDDLKNCNFLLRSKEDAQDYRYFPEPDLSTIVLDEEHLEELKASIPELPNKKVVRYMQTLSIPEEDARLLVESIEKAAYFEEIIAAGKIVPKDAANWVLGAISRVINETGKSIAEIGIPAAHMAKLIEMLEKKEISSSAGSTVFEEMLHSDKAPADIVAEKGLAQVSDQNVLQQIVDQVAAANQKSIDDYRGGKTNAL
ncbi:MAG TPA: Asp-tRNA(Asn)/Glu-tRNA(Gln) amidotransferase subunit GatB, partial [Candidatus Faecivivens stercorigallinarum]|nr:Asp-tRNA(Asn)/Glu-tRNA(Gln) amidotransferase subunit GatB [Candidatus Faecivivens stercorigallinarum]